MKTPPTNASLASLAGQTSLIHARAYYKPLQADVVAERLTFAEACAHPNAKRLVFHGYTGPVNAVEVDGTFFIENDEAEAKTARLKSSAAAGLGISAGAVATPAAAADAEFSGALDATATSEASSSA